jgi:hypothetical protein
MKVTELLTEIRYSDTNKASIYRGRLHAYYDKNSGEVAGYTGDWMNKMGVERSHIKPAMEEVRKSKEYTDLLALGFDEQSTKRDLSNGTFFFKGRRGNLIGLQDEGEDARYRILVNGRITGYSADGDKQNRQKSPHPSTIDTDPNLTPVERLVKTYRQTMAQLFKVQSPKFERALMKRLKKD